MLLALQAVPCDTGTCAGGRRALTAPFSVVSTKEFLPSSSGGAARVQPRGQMISR